METEIPVFKRCFCCFPLRYGLLVWGYIKIIAYTILIPAMIYWLVMVTFMLILFVGIRHLHEMQSTVVQLVIAFITAINLITDLVATIVFIVAGHKKNVKLLRVYYFYSIAMLIVTTLLAALFVCVVIVDSITDERFLQSYGKILIMCSSYFVIIAQQSYFLLLLRSENIKLRDNGEFRFVNNAAEAECTMKCEDRLVEEDKAVEVV